MKRIVVSLLLGLLAGSRTGAQQVPIDYRLDEVRRSVTLTHAGKQLRADKGQLAKSGDSVTTGWLSYAMIASERHRARFEIFGGTSVRLTSDTPGVVLSLDRGRIRAAFDKITGSEPRTVQTPGALLAVRGTKFDVEVDRSGNTTLDVFEGIVEVQHPLRPQPMMIRAGEESSFGPRNPPEMRPMPEQRKQNGPDGDRGERPKNDRGGDPRGNDPNRPPGSGGHGQPGQGGGGAPPPPPPPPHKPPAD